MAHIIWAILYGQYLMRMIIKRHYLIKKINKRLPVKKAEHEDDRKAGKRQDPCFARKGQKDRQSEEKRCKERQNRVENKVTSPERIPAELHHEHIFLQSRFLIIRDSFDDLLAEKTER